MEPKEFKDQLEKVYSTTNENGELSKVLSNIQDQYEAFYKTKIETDKTLSEKENELKTLTDMNEKLRNVNMDLFLKVGTTKPDPTQPPKQEENRVPLMEVYE